MTDAGADGLALMLRVYIVSAAQADALAIVPVGRDVANGELVDYRPLDKG